MNERAMKLDLTKAKKIRPFVKCWEDGQEMFYAECIHCRCFIPLLWGDMMCLAGVAGLKKEIIEWEQQD